MFGEEIKYGKYKGRTWEWLRNNDRNYLKRLPTYETFKKFSSKEQKFIKEQLIPSIEKTRNKKAWTPTYVKDIKQLLLEGHTREEVEKHFQKTTKLAPSTISHRVSLAIMEIRDDIKTTRARTIDVHLLRYDRLIQKYLQEYYLVPSSKDNALKLKNTFLLFTLKALERKEALLGFHTKTLNVQINNHFSVESISRSKVFHFDNLSLEELRELCSLLEVVYGLNLYKEPIHINFYDEDEQDIQEAIVVEDEETKEEVKPVSDIRVEGDPIITTKSGFTFEDLKRRIQEENRKNLDNKLKNK